MRISDWSSDVCSSDLPTTANYILMATLMAPVVVELGAQSGLVIPLIAVHMFVFYYGIMADITPPVGLATFAAAAISGEDPIKTGVQGVTYAMRTAVLPFMFIFNPLLLLIDVEGTGELILVVGGAILASLTFAAATMRWMRSKATWLEVVLLLLVTRSEEHTSELQSLMRISYAVFCLKKKTIRTTTDK